MKCWQKWAQKFDFEHHSPPNITTQNLRNWGQTFTDLSNSVRIWLQFHIFFNWWKDIVVLIINILLWRVEFGIWLSNTTDNFEPNSKFHSPQKDVYTKISSGALQTAVNWDQLKYWKLCFQKFYMIWVCITNILIPILLIFFIWGMMVHHFIVNPPKSTNCR